MKIFLISNLNQNTMKCVFYGNCQMKALADIFSKIQNRYTVIPINTVHKLTLFELDQLYQILPNIDLLVIQPISDRYKNNSRLSTTNILQAINLKCRVIMLPVCYFRFYYPSICCLSTLQKQYAECFHDVNLLQLYCQKLNHSEIIEKYQKIVDNPDFYTSENLLTIANQSLNELENRDNLMREKYTRVNDFIVVTNFIRQHFQQTLLFYTINHPTKILIQYIIDRLNQLLLIPLMIINEDPFCNKHPILYQSIQSVVEFDIKQYHPKLDGHDGFTNIVLWQLYLLDKNVFKLQQNRK